MWRPDLDDESGPAEMPKLHLAPQDAAADDKRPPYSPAYDLLNGTRGVEVTWLLLYQSRDRFGTSEAQHARSGASVTDAERT